MSIERHVAKAAAITGAAMVGRALLTETSVTLGDHRGLSHRAIELSPWLHKSFQVEQKTAGTNGNEWAAAHRNGHHQFPDADLYPFWQTWHVIQEATRRGIQAPEHYYGYDKLVNRFHHDDVVDIGVMMEEYLQDMLGDRSPKPDFSGITDAELQQHLHNKDPKYWYDEKMHDRNYVFTDEDTAHNMLRDQHSPLLAPPNPNGTWNGVMYVFHHNTALSSTPTRNMRQRPYMMPEDLRPDSDEPIERNTKNVIAGFAAMSAIAMLLGRDKSIKALLERGILGSVANAGGLLVLKKGSDIVNAFGHIGVMTPEALWQAMTQEDFEMKPYPDGRLSSDTEDAGVIGKLMSLFTQDEAGKQRMHHLYPGAIAYNPPDGSHLKRETPWGSIVQWATDSKFVPFIKHGPGLPRNKHGRRPDEEHPAMDIIHTNRVRTMNEGYTT